MATKDVPRGGDRPRRRPRVSLWAARPENPMRPPGIGLAPAAAPGGAGATPAVSATWLVLWLFPGLLLAAIAVAWPPQRIPPPERLDITGMFYWVIAVAALFEWEASAWKDDSLPWHPSLTDLINPLLDPHIVKSAAILLWILVGWALVRR